MDWLKPIDAYCERLGPEFWAEPFNAITNIFMLLAGVVGFCWWSRLKREPQSPSPSPSLSPNWLGWLSFAACLTALGSFLFHTYANFLTLWGNILPILFFMQVFLAFSLREIFKWKWAATVVVMILFFVIGIALQLLLPKDLWNGSLTYAHGVLVLGAMTVALRVQPSLGRMYGIAFVTFLISLFFRTLDHAWCESWPYGTHFIWHTFNACLLFQLIRIVNSRYRSA